MQTGAVPLGTSSRGAGSAVQQVVFCLWVGQAGLHG